MKLKFLSLAMFGFVIFSTAAEAQELIGIQEQIDALKEEMIILQRKVYRETTDAPIAVSGAAAGQAQVQLSQYDEIIRTVNGKIDELEYKIKQLEEKITTINNDMDTRFRLLEGKPIAAGQNTAGTTKKFDAAVAVGAPRSITGEAVTAGELKQLASTTAGADELYKSGLEELKAGNSARAEQNFMLILDKYPSDKLAGNAQYWLGEVYYKDKNFSKAAVAFGRGYEKYKNGTKGADCLLKLGLSMARLNKKNEACLAFTNIPTEFPHADKSIFEKAKAEAQKLGCR